MLLSCVESGCVLWNEKVAEWKRWLRGRHGECRQKLCGLADSRSEGP